ncbi:M90 family metallopeptidase [Cyanobacterium sp. HL-69]|uniref:M90 family metallopeptidase n=1 Tax=Cyanobacterium sp. HL-69 TaxID=2054282 RepID=UPI00406BC5F5
MNQEWISFLENNVYLYKKLPEQYKPQLHNYIKIFIAEKEFIGKEGIEVTEQMKLMITSQACLLLLDNNPNFLHPNKSNYFPYLKFIYIYPDRIENKLNKKVPESSLLLGQSSVGHKSGKDGNILLSWLDVKLESQSYNSESNVVLHEFSHQLDQEFGNATGTPKLKNLEATLIWQNIFKIEYQKLCLSIEKQEYTLIDKYGATNPVEFFAVATEAFFLKGKLIAVNHPLLYEQLRQYYQVDPALW